MSARSEESSAFIRFCDSLFQEQNIKWLLGLGTLILLSSSTMLVTSHWESYPPLWKYAVLLGYTSLIHAAGQMAYHRLALRKTGTGLMSLTVLLIPLTFASYRWVHPASVLSIDGLFAQSGLLVLLGANSVFSFFAARRIFCHFLRSTQPTFLSSYLILAAFGAIVPALPPAWATVMAIISWIVFAIGATKVNRHTFWLAEEYRKPRIFGFFPIILLGTQFLTIFATSLFPHVAFEWMGLGLVLTAIPILLAAETLANVIQCRSGVATPKLAPSVIISMIIGVAVVMGGLFLSGYGYPETVALVPTSILAAIVMGLVARRTQRVELVWMMLLFVVTAYQTSPVFFKELVVRLLDQGAAAIGEERMPLAFYGLTYLPLLFVTTLTSRWFSAKENHLFAKPLKQFSVVFPLVLLPVAFAHPKAILPVSVALGTLLTFQTFFYRDRRIQVAALAAFFTAIFGSLPFVDAVYGWAPNSQLALMTWVIGGGLLLFPGAIFDHMVKKIPESNPNQGIDNLSQKASLGIITCCAVAWTAQTASGVIAPLPGIICFAFLVWHSFRFKHVLVSCLTLVIPLFLTFTLTGQAGWEYSVQLTLSAILLAGMSLFGLVLNRNPQHLVSQVFQQANAVIANTGIIILQTFLIPLMMSGIVGMTNFSMWGAATISLIAGANLTWRSRSSVLIVLSWLSLLALSGVAIVESLPGTAALILIPVVWATLATALTPFVRYLSHLNKNSGVNASVRCLSTLEWCVSSTLGLIALASLPFLSGTLRVAALIALAGSFVLVYRRRANVMTDLLLAIANCHLLVMIAQFFSPNMEFLFDLKFQQIELAAMPIAFAAALSAIFWEHRRNVSAEIASFTSKAVQGLSFAGLLCFSPLLHIGMTTSQLVFAILTFTVLIVIQCRIALKKMSENTGEATDEKVIARAEFHVWIAQGLAVCALGFLNINFTTLALFAPLGVSIVLWCTSKSCKNAGRWMVFYRPLQKTAFVLPAFSVVIGVSEHLFNQSVDWIGVNSLALLLAGAFYFWRGLEDRKPGLIFGSALILNISLAMLWNDLQWSDPQLFLVPVGMTILALVVFLKEQIPDRFRAPLQYAGALTILVSPTFEIVGGSWLHLISLMIASVVIVVVAMGLRIRALIYTGTAFLIADLIAIVVRGSIDQPSLLWLAGIAVGAAVIGFAAYCERHREKMLQQLRFLAAELETWN